MSFRKKNTVPCLLLSYFILLSGSTQAAEDFWSDFYLGFAVGESELSRFDVCEQSAVQCDLKESSQKFFSGYEFNTFFSAEFGYMRYGGFELATNNESHLVTDIDSLFINSFLSYPVFEWVNVFGKLGLNRWSIKGDLFDKELSSNDLGYGISYGLGMNFSLSKSIGIRTEWERLFLDKNESDSLMGSVILSF
ncbi:MAG: porin family protein [Gammaproteobacteria bacterium]|nr:porin family protein [Gammaproteobacteria bacterium]